MPERHRAYLLTDDQIAWHAVQHAQAGYRSPTARICPRRSQDRCRRPKTARPIVILGPEAALWAALLRAGPDDRVRHGPQLGVLPAARARPGRARGADHAPVLAGRAAGGWPPSGVPRARAGHLVGRAACAVTPSDHRAVQSSARLHALGRTRAVDVDVDNHDPSSRKGATPDVATGQVITSTPR